MKKFFRGADVMVFLASSRADLQSGNTQTIGYATNHTLTLNFDNVEVSTKDGGLWAESEISKASWEMTCDALYTINGNTDINTGASSSATSGFDTLFQLATATGSSNNEIYVAFARQRAPKSSTHGIPTESVTTGESTYYYGKAIISSLSANAAVGDNASFSVTFQGVGALTKKA